MAIKLSDNIKLIAPKMLDERYGPWTGITHANDNILSLQRTIGLTCGIFSGATLYEYWYYTGIGNSDLVLKLSAPVDMSNFATKQSNTFVGDQTILGTVFISGNTFPSIQTNRGFDVVSSDGETIIGRTVIAVSGSTGNYVVVGQGYITIRGDYGHGGVPLLNLLSTDPLNSDYFEISLNGLDNDLNPHDGPAITLSNSPGQFITVIGFQDFTGWTDGHVTFYTPILGMSGMTMHGDINLINGQYLINGVPLTVDHSQLTNLLWENSGHKGTPNTLAGFDSLGNAIEFPTSSGDTISLFTVDNSGVEILSGDTFSTIYNSALDSGLTTPAAVGGIPINTSVASLTGKTLVEIVNDLLFPSVGPTYTIPTITFSGIVSGVAEIKSTLVPSITPLMTKNDAGSCAQMRVLRNNGILFSSGTIINTPTTNVPPQFGFADPNNPNETYSINPFPDSFQIPLPGVGGTSVITTYNVNSDYLGGLPKKNNKGILDARIPLIRSVNAPQAGDSNFASSSAVITGIFPYFWGISPTLPTTASIAAAIASGAANKVLVDASGTLSINYNIPVTYMFIWFAYFGNYVSKTKWFVTVLNSGDIDNTFISTAVIQSVNGPPSSFWTGQNYKMHWSLNPTIQTVIQFS